MERQSQEPRVLIFSQRNIFPNDLFRCPLYEFEDIIAQVDRAEIMSPQGDPTTRWNHLANRLAFHAPIMLTTKLEKLQINKRYDMFFAICGSPRDLVMLDAVRDWRSACKTSVCLLDEMWVKQMDNHRFFLRALEGFDLVVLYYSGSVDALHKRIGSKCVFLPPGVDSIRFCPYPDLPKRCVDVYSVGRRSQITHQALLKMVDEAGLFYLHDSVAGLEAINPREHRSLFANLAKRSRYFIVNPGLVDRPDKRGTQSEAGNRYFEGASAGAILIGERPSNGEFGRLFDWPDALIELPYNSDRIGAMIRELDSQPKKQDEIRRSNIVNTLKRHDWVYRWEAILKEVGLSPLSELSERKERLKTLAEDVCAMNQEVG
jgi:hypothetical protein